MQKPTYKQEVIEMNDVDRFIEFSHFRSQIRSSKAHLIVGIDVAKDKHHAFSVLPMADIVASTCFYQ